MMRLPTQPTAKGLDACFVGVPMDIGTSNRPGTRFGPRQIRAESCFVRPYNMATRAAPFDSLQVADIGDVAIDTFNLPKCMDIITNAYNAILAEGCIPLTLGGDHTIAYPDPARHGEEARAGRPRSMSTPMPTSTSTCSASRSPTARRSAAPSRTACSTPSAASRSACAARGYAADDFDWPRQQGFRVVQAEECWHKSLTPLMAEVREQMGDGPVYFSFDIDSLDPAFAPGTGTPEIGGLTTHPGAGDHPRLLGAEPRRLRSGRSVAALRHHRQHRADGGQSAVRDALRAARRAAAYAEQLQGQRRPARKACGEAAMATCGEYLVKLLEAYGVELIFGIPGVHTVELYRGLPATKIRHITPRHEQGAGFMADGYARVTGKPGVCFIITGPGMTNIATAMGQAYADSVPMLVISSVNAREQLGMRHGRLHELPSQQGLVSGVTAFSHTILAPSQLPEILACAFAVFSSSRPRPVHIEIPLDVIVAEVDDSNPTAWTLPSRPAPQAAQIEQAASLLGGAKRPLIIAGGGAQDAAGDIRALAERLDAPVFMTINGKGILPPGHGWRSPAISA